MTAAVPHRVTAVYTLQRHSDTDGTFGITWYPRAAMVGGASPFEDRRIKVHRGGHLASAAGGSVPHLSAANVVLVCMTSRCSVEINIPFKGAFGIDVSEITCAGLHMKPSKSALCCNV